MSWPTPQDYNEAVQNPRLAFADSDLRIGQPELTPLGLPRPISGNFACVYKIQTSNQRWAARCFVKEVPDLQHRYKAISEYLLKARLPYTIPFTYDPNGIKIQGRTFPLLKMQWVQGDSLNTFVGNAVGYPDTLLSTARCWVKMMADLKAVNIAHGDLQHGNILVVGDQLRLIDYDGMFVPALAGKPSNELGLPNYQLPSRSQWDYGPYLDNFSAWVIYVSLIALAVHPELWSTHRGGDECLIFRKNDFADPAKSALLQELNSSPNDGLRFLVEMFVGLFSLSPQDVPALDGKLPTIKVEPPKPWYSDYFEKPKHEENILPAETEVRGEESVISDPGWIVDSLTEDSPIEPVRFQSQTKELRIVASGSLALVILTRLFIEMPMSDLFVMVSFVFGMNMLLCFIRYKSDPSHAEFGVFKDEAKNFLREIRQHQTLIDSVLAERQALKEKQAKAERELAEQKNRLSKDLQAELVRLAAGLSSQLQSVNQRRQTTRTDETNKLNSLQATLGSQILDLDRRISNLIQAETDEKQRATTELQNNVIQSRLRSRFIANSAIHGIGASYKSRLRIAGINTAADIDWRVNRVHGIGPTRHAALMAWRNSVESEARRHAPSLSASDRQAIENKYRSERQTHEAGKQRLQTELNAQISSARQYFADIRQSLNQEEQQTQAAKEHEKNRVQQEYSTRFATLDAEIKRAKDRLAPAMDELSEKLRVAQKQIFALRWKAEKHKKGGRRFASLRFRNYLNKIISP